jgi:hypothetical protein
MIKGTHDFFFFCFCTLPCILIVYYHPKKTSDLLSFTIMAIPTLRRRLPAIHGRKTLAIGPLRMP